MNFTFPKNTTDTQNYYYFANGLSEEEIKKIIDESASLQEKVGIVGANTVDQIRSSRIKWIPQNSDWAWLYEKLIYFAGKANDELWKFDLHTVPESIQLTEYDSSYGGHYGWHQDIGKGLSSLRKVSITVQLSDPSDYKGGDLEIWKCGDAPLSTPKGRGVVVIFPSYMMHRVTKLTEGKRRSLVLWVGGDHYR